MNIAQGTAACLRRVMAATAGVAFVVCPAGLGRAWAQSSPSATLCRDLLVFDALPARTEWAYWVSGGAALASQERAGPVVGLGAELSWSVATHRGFPAGLGVAGRRMAELRLGPWLAAATRAEGGLVEGGLALHWGAVDRAAFGTFDLRLGGGLAAFRNGRSPTVDVTLAWGTQSTLARYRRRRACEPSAEAVRFGESSVLRVFVTRRDAISNEHAHEIVIGIELSPSFFLPPYSWRRLSGGDAR